MQRGIDAPIWADAGAHYPVLLYSHGLTGSPLSSEYTQTIALYASYGYVVVAPFHGDARFADLSIGDFSDLRRLFLNNGYRQAIEMQAMRAVGLQGALDRLVAYLWPGNVRQLINVVEQVQNLCKTKVVQITSVLLQRSSGTSHFIRKCSAL